MYGNSLMTCIATYRGVGQNKSSHDIFESIWRNLKVIIPTESKNHYVLTACCPGIVGTTAKLSGFLARRHCYITDMQQFDDILSNRFFIRCNFLRDTELSPSLDALRFEFIKAASEEGMEWAIHDDQSRTRVLIMVSKFDHCLNDLLYRHSTGELKMDVTAVVSNHPDLRKLVEWHNIPYHHLPISAESKFEQEIQLKNIIEETKSELVVLARYMQVLSDDLCHYLQGRAINIHRMLFDAHLQNQHRRSNCRRVVD